nr:hypothetical protein [Chondromyces apiculatus]
MSLPCSVQTLPLRVNTLTEPEFTPPTLSDGVPTSAVSPESASEVPKRS